MKYLLAACIGTLFSLFLCTFAVGHGDLEAWTQGQRYFTSSFMGIAFIVPIFIGFLDGEL
jgi:hypothetical protein